MFTAGPFKPIDEKTLHTIGGKNLVGHATKEDVDILLGHISALEHFLDLSDHEDTFGTEGWRHMIGLK